MIAGSLSFPFRFSRPANFSVRLKGGMSLRNDTWHGLRNDIIMRNVKYGKWRREINQTKKDVRVFAAPFFGANLSEQLFCWSIY